ncbi:hypothetical protein EJB05_28958, partial [Eragrostis curvula]
MDDERRRAGEEWGTRSPRAALAPHGPQRRRELDPSPQELGPHLWAAPSSEGPRPLREPARSAQELVARRAAAPSSEGMCPLRELAPSARDPGGDARWWMESPASLPSSPGRAGCPELRAAAPSFTDGDAVLKKRRLLQACRRAPVEGGERKEQRGQWWKKVEIGVDFVPDSQGGTDDDLVFLLLEDDSQAVHDHELLDDQLVLEDDSQAVDDHELLDDQLVLEDNSQAVDDHELLDDQLLLEDDSQAVDDEDLLLVDDDSQPLTRSGSMFKSSKFGPAPSSPCAAPPSPDSSGAPSGSCTGELLRSKNPGPSGMEGAPSPGGVQGPPSPCAAAGMASSSK